jgi:LacI family transcriptional regulator
MAAATLIAVAQLAGVSTSTASRALTGHPSVLPDTREKVLAAARSLRYRPNRMASALRTRRTGLIGLVVNNLWNASFTAIADEVQAWGATEGQQVLVCSTDGDPAREAAFLDTVAEHHFDGVVIAGSGGNHDRINALLDEGTAVVTMNREVPGARATSVMPGYTTAGRLAVEHLLAAGHTRVAEIGGLDRFTSGREQHVGIVEALGAAGLPADPALIERGPFDPAFGRAATERLLDLAAPPTALLITNHEAIFGVLPVLSERRIEIPSGLSVICTEDEPSFAWWHPPMTVVDNRATDMGRAAVVRLVEQLTGVATGVHRDVVEPVLVVRGSTGPPSRT